MAACFRWSSVGLYTSGKNRGFVSAAACVCCCVAAVLRCAAALCCCVRACNRRRSEKRRKCKLLPQPLTVGQTGRSRPFACLVRRFASRRCVVPALSPSIVSNSGKTDFVSKKWTNDMECDHSSSHFSRCPRSGSAAVIWTSSAEGSHT